MKKFNKKVAKKPEPEEEVESGSEEEEVDASLEEEDEDEEDEVDDLLDNEAEEDDGEEEEDGGEEEEDDEEEDDEEDDDSEEDEDENPLAPKKIPFNTPKVEAKNDLVAKFLDINGKRLYVRFPHKLPETKEELIKQLKSYCKLITEVIKPRQKHARHCMAEFKNKEDRENALKVLSAVKIDDKALVVKVPTYDNEEKAQSAVEKQAKKKQEKKMKQKLRKLAKKKAAMITSTLFISNIPPTATVADLKEHFPNAIDIKVKHNKDNQATAKGSVTLPTPEDAAKARKQKFTIDDKVLSVKFDVSGKNTSWRAKQNKKFKSSQKAESNPKPGQKRYFNNKVKVEKTEPSAKKIKTEKTESVPKIKTEKTEPAQKKAKPAAKVIAEKKGKKPKINKKPKGVSV